MFDLMDYNREAYEKMEAEKNELDELWKKEKDNLRKTQMVFYSSLPLSLPLSPPSLPPSIPSCYSPSSLSEYSFSSLQRKLELESQLEEEKMKIEHEKMNIEKEKVVLETKVKHIGEQSEKHACY
jgi:hypothetical protein